jgi:hypothetical protein
MKINHLVQKKIKLEKKHAYVVIIIPKKKTTNAY